MTLIFFSLLIGMALGAFLKGALKVGLVVALAVAAVAFTCRELHVDWQRVAGITASQAREQFQRVQPTHTVVRSRHHTRWM